MHCGADRSGARLALMLAPDEAVHWAENAPETAGS